MQTIIETPAYLSDAKALGLDSYERKVIVDYLAAHPGAGEEMVGTGGARKLRFAGRGKGKSGGYRVVTFYAGKDVPVFLLAIFSKGERANLSQTERNELKQILSSIVKIYKKGAKNYVQSRQ